MLFIIVLLIIFIIFLVIFIVLYSRCKVFIVEKENPSSSFVENTNNQSKSDSLVLLDEQNKPPKIGRLASETKRRKELYNEAKKAIALLEEDIILKQNKYKPNWQYYRNIIVDYNINTLYHFTALANIESIKTHGALYSWHYCLNNNIIIPKPGGNEISRVLDSNNNLQNYVRVSFAKYHPMMYSAVYENRIRFPVILEIDVDVIYWENTKFSNINATKRGAIIGSDLECFKQIKFDIVKCNNQRQIIECNRPYFQAEVMVLEKIPIEFIKNINSL